MARNRFTVITHQRRCQASEGARTWARIRRRGLRYSLPQRGRRRWHGRCGTPTSGTGLHVMSGGWMLMGHVMLNGVYDWQQGPRGDDKAFVSGMLMGMARRPLGNGTLQLSAMLSPDPLMGPSGYPLLLARRDRRRRRDRLVDRQHPHDLFMELSASATATSARKAASSFTRAFRASRRSGRRRSCIAEAILDSPEAPISHHWLDSDAHQLRRGDGRRRARPGQARGEPLQRARAGPAPVEYGDRAARFRRQFAYRGTRRRSSRCRAAGGISSIPSSSSPE